MQQDKQLEAGRIEEYIWSKLHVVEDRFSEDCLKILLAYY